jgi:shikimate kinase
VIVLVGFMGAGKSTVGARLAQRLGLTFHDVDQVIEQRAGTSVAALFDNYGEPYFRDLEQATVRELLAGPDAVIALGGGAAEHEQVQGVLAGTTVVYLEVSHRQALARVGHDPRRPMLRRTDLEQVHERRTIAYRALASVVVSTDDRDTEAIVAEVVAALSPNQPPGPAQPA